MDRHALDRAVLQRSGAAMEHGPQAGPSGIGGKCAIHGCLNSDILNSRYCNTHAKSSASLRSTPTESSASRRVVDSPKGFVARRGQNRPFRSFSSRPSPKPESPVADGDRPKSAPNFLRMPVGKISSSPLASSQAAAKRHSSNPEALQTPGYRSIKRACYESPAQGNLSQLGRNSSVSGDNFERQPQKKACETTKAKVPSSSPSPAIVEESGESEDSAESSKSTIEVCTGPIKVLPQRQKEPISKDKSCEDTQETPSVEAYVQTQDPQDLVRAPMQINETRPSSSQAALSVGHEASATAMKVGSSQSPPRGEKNGYSHISSRREHRSLSSDAEIATDCSQPQTASPMQESNAGASEATWSPIESDDEGEAVYASEATWSPIKSDDEGEAAYASEATWSPIKSDDEGEAAYEADESNASTPNIPPANPGTLIQLPKGEARRQARVDRFDSDGFDRNIYAQSELSPPKGITVQAKTQASRDVSASRKDERLYLAVNPMIHRVHNGSEEWHEHKAEEIETRGGRKAWFGKATQRMRWLREQQAAKDERRQRALQAGKQPPREDPEPWTYKRPMDFGDVPEEDLPEYVRNNPAWLKACAWHRETRQLAAQRHREGLKQQRETEVYYETVARHFSK